MQHIDAICSLKLELHSCSNRIWSKALTFFQKQLISNPSEKTQTVVADRMETIEIMIDQKVQIQIEAVQIIADQTTGQGEVAVVVEDVGLIEAVVVVEIITYLVEKKFTFYVPFLLAI